MKEDKGKIESCLVEETEDKKGKKLVLPVWEGISRIRRRGRNSELRQREKEEERM